MSTEKAANVLSFHPAGDVKSIVFDLIDHFEKFRDLDNPLYSNIQSFKKMDSEVRDREMVGALA